MNNNNIKIRSLSMNDFELVLKWSQDDVFCQANQWELNRNPEELYEWWFKCVTNTSENFVRMGIALDGRLIGYTDLANIHENTAELGIAIGERTLWGQGIGVEAALCTLQFASTQLGLTTFEAETHETNTRSRKMLEKIGFKEMSRIGFEEYLGDNSQLIQYQLIFKNDEEPYL